MHLSLCETRYDAYSAPVFTVEKDGRLGVEFSRYRSGNAGEPLNPFSAEGKSAIAAAAEKGIAIDHSERDDVRETVSRILPDLAKPIGRALGTETERDMANELEAGIAERVGPGVRNRIHVTGFR